LFREFKKDLINQIKSLDKYKNKEDKEIEMLVRERVSFVELFNVFDRLEKLERESSELNEQFKKLERKME
jgi:predicted nuclease with TOPRIM domain